MDLVLEQPHHLHWLWAVAALAALGVLSLRGTRRRLLRFAELPLLGRVAPSFSLSRSALRLVLFVASLGLVTVAMADPRWGVFYTDIPRRGLDVMVLLDVSRSMLAEDARPNRLERAKQAISDVVETLGGDRVGLMVFAGDASLVCPLTLSYESFRTSLREADIRSADRGGSMIGDALRAAAASFLDPADEEPQEGKVILLVTDGEDLGSLPVEAAAQMRESRKVRTYTVGIGDATEGATIPIVEGGGRTDLTYDGQVVRSRMDAELLAKIATAGDGAFIPLGTATGDVGAMFQRVTEGLTVREGATGPVRQRHPRFQLFAGAALALLVAECLVSGRRRSRHSKEVAP
ncbi:MAG: VWA domain-containing protein [Phycisphaerales bacterium]|nr:VWA domain-containing protein [Phycisphaerales bacterium]